MIAIDNNYNREPFLTALHGIGTMSRIGSYGVLDHWLGRCWPIIFRLTLRPATAYPGPMKTNSAARRVCSHFETLPNERRQ